MDNGEESNDQSPALHDMQSADTTSSEQQSPTGVFSNIRAEEDCEFKPSVNQNLCDVVRVMRRNDDKAVVQCILMNDSGNSCASTVTVYRKYGSLYNINRHLTKHGVKIYKATWDEIKSMPLHESDTTLEDADDSTNGTTSSLNTPRKGVTKKRKPNHDEEDSTSYPDLFSGIVASTSEEWAPRKKVREAPDDDDDSSQQGTERPTSQIDDEHELQQLRKDRLLAEMDALRAKKAMYDSQAKYAKSQEALVSTQLLVEREKLVYYKNLNRRDSGTLEDDTTQLLNGAHLKP